MRGAREPARLGSQTLFRGLDVLEVVAEGAITLGDLADRLGLTRSTTHRLASALVDRRYLSFVPRIGYTLGPKLLELGFRVRDELNLPRVAGPQLERLALLTEDTVHLGVLDHGRVLYLDKIPGQRRVNIRSRVGEMQPVSSTGLGKALILDLDEAAWTDFFRAEKGARRASVSLNEWLARMRHYAQVGHAFDLEENEDQIRCVAAPIRDVASRIVAAISVSSAAQYMSDERMRVLTKAVVETAHRISEDLGWKAKTPHADAAQEPPRTSTRRAPPSSTGQESHGNRASAVKAHPANTAASRRRIRASSALSHARKSGKNRLKPTDTG
jgi:DNA-binding IclR family transcriptional regulator